MSFGYYGHSRIILLLSQCSQRSSLAMTEVSKPIALNHLATLDQSWLVQNCTGRRAQGLQPYLGTQSSGLVISHSAHHGLLRKGSC